MNGTQANSSEQSIISGLRQGQFAYVKSTQTITLPGVERSLASLNCDVHSYDGLRSLTLIENGYVRGQCCLQDF